MGTSDVAARVHRLHPAPFRGGRELAAACLAELEVLDRPGQPSPTVIAKSLSLPGLGPLGTLAVDHHGRPCVVVAAAAHDAVTTLVGRVVTSAAALSTCSVTDLDHLTSGHLERALQARDGAARRRCFEDALRSGQVRFILVLDKVGPRHLDPLIYLSRNTAPLLRVIELQRFVNADGDHVLVPHIQLDDQAPVPTPLPSQTSPGADTRADTRADPEDARAPHGDAEPDGELPAQALRDAPLFHGIVASPPPPDLEAPDPTPVEPTRPDAGAAPVSPASPGAASRAPASPRPDLPRPDLPSTSRARGASSAPEPRPSDATHVALEVLERELPPKLSILDASDTICLGHEGWPRHLHYALAHDQETARLAIQLENDFVRPLANLLIAMTEELSELFPEAKVAWDPTWSKNRGRLAITCATHDPTHVARDMTRLIAASAPRIDAALQSLRSPN